MRVYNRYYLNKFLKKKKGENYMHSKKLFNEKERTLDDLSLTELENKVFEITKNQNYISNLHLSKEVTSLAVNELQERKKDLLEAMHRKVDTL